MIGKQKVDRKLHRGTSSKLGRSLANPLVSSSVCQLHGVVLDGFLT